MEQAFTHVLRNFFPVEKEDPNPRAKFYAKYKQEVEHADKDFQKKYDEDLNTTLVFVCVPISVFLLPTTDIWGAQAGLFSAVTSGFIINVQDEITPDYNEETAALLRVMLYKMDNTTFGGQAPPLPTWDGPDHDVVTCQTLLYASLGISLLSAFLATLGKQWLNRFAKAEAKGPEIDESRSRQRKLSGMVSWKFDLVMESIPLMLQFALLLLGYALSKYLWIINLTVASVVIAIMCLGSVFYILIVIAATITDDCPFQTPASQILRGIYRLDNSHNRYIARIRHAIYRLWLGTTRLYRTIIPKLLPPRTQATPLVGLPQENRAVRLFDRKETDRDTHTVDAGCIIWMIDTARGKTASQIISDFIPEVVWHPDIKCNPSLPYLYGQAVECFNFEGRTANLISRLRDQAFAATKAFIHVYSQMRVTGVIDDSFIHCTRIHHTQLANGQHNGDLDLESTLWLMDYIMDKQREIDWNETKLSYSHLTWMAHVILPLVWLRGGQLDECFQGLVTKVLDWGDWRMGTDCILMLCLSLGIPVHPEDLLVVDKQYVPVIKIPHSI